MRNVILFSDIHEDPACFNLITKLLPELKQQGYTKIFMETPNQGIDFLIKHVSNSIKLIEIFPNGKVSEDINEQQEQALMDYSPAFENYPDRVIGSANALLDELNGKLAWCKARLKMLKKIKELNLNAISVDAPNPGQYNFAGGIGRRTNFMLNKINSDLADNSKAIIITGHGHAVDSLEHDNIRWEYNKGFIRLFREIDITVDHWFLAYSNDNDLTNNVLQMVRKCAKDIAQTAKIVNLSDMIIPNNLQAIVDISTNIDLGLSHTQQGSYVKYTIPRESSSYSQAIKKYIEDLEGTEIQDFFINGRAKLIQFTMDSSKLTQGNLEELQLTKKSFAMNEHFKSYISRLPGATIETMGTNNINLVLINKQNIIDHVNGKFSEFSQQNASDNPNSLFSGNAAGEGNHPSSARARHFKNSQF